MRVSQFYHVARAAAAIANVEYVNVFGANAILPWLSDLGMDDMRNFLDPDDISRELDLCVGDGTDDNLNTLIDGTIGELTYFDVTFNAYAHPNPMEGLFKAPSSWPKRARIVKEPSSNTKIVVPHYLDLIISKIIAGRPKDLEFAARVVALFNVQEQDLLELVEEYVQEHPEDEEGIRRTINILKQKLAAGNLEGPSL